MKKKQHSMADIIGQQTDLTKDSINQVSDIIIQEFNSGKHDPLDFLGKLEFMAQTLEKAIAQVREQALPELEKYGQEAKAGVKKNGITFKVKETGVKYDYSNTSKWVAMNNELTQVKESMKALETQLKAIKGKQTLVDESTGELIELFPPIKSSKTTIEITIPK